LKSERDYRKFLNDAGGLDVRLLPRGVYTALVNEYRNRASVIDEVFEQLYLTWDLQQEMAGGAGDDGPARKSAAAQTILDGLDDNDWWRVISAFEKALIRDFIDNAPDWSANLDPVYDEQELHGWRKLQP
jgi:hypothetical protein